ncbi:hypothetical protein [Arthrospiribacter ruber]|uniref:Uncharacterized protein n=1 Tax=Arthrospiribacter ruber TaxID=2487934 RepID=A0A951MCE5_9BACT|nr:hypothetical protein [Arthrospiribacter ruber]MBW3467427.1 hypothetical protein [Arthrospiribacter ruber]
MTIPPYLSLVIGACGDESLSRSIAGDLLYFGRLFLRQSDVSPRSMSMVVKRKPVPQYCGESLDKKGRRFFLRQNDGGPTVISFL